MTPLTKFSMFWMVRMTSTDLARWRAQIQVRVCMHILTFSCSTKIAGGQRHKLFLENAIFVIALWCGRKIGTYYGYLSSKVGWIYKTYHILWLELMTLYSSSQVSNIELYMHRAVSVNFQYQWIYSISIFNFTWIQPFLLRHCQEQYDLRLLHRNILIER